MGSLHGFTYKKGFIEMFSQIRGVPGGSLGFMRLIRVGILQRGSLKSELQDTLEFELHGSLKFVLQGSLESELHGSLKSELLGS